MLKGDKIFYSFFETKKPIKKVFKKGNQIDLGMNILPISEHEKMIIEWWESDSRCFINKKMLEQLKLVRLKPDFKPTYNLLNGGSVYRVS